MTLHLQSMTFKDYWSRLRLASGCFITRQPENDQVAATGDSSKTLSEARPQRQLLRVKIKRCSGWPVGLAAMVWSEHNDGGQKWGSNLKIKENMSKRLFKCCFNLNFSGSGMGFNEFPQDGVTQPKPQRILRGGGNDFAMSRTLNTGRITDVAKTGGQFAIDLAGQKVRQGFAGAKEIMGLRGSLNFMDARAGNAATYLNDFDTTNRRLRGANNQPLMADRRRTATINRAGLNTRGVTAANRLG